MKRAVMVLCACMAWAGVAGAVTDVQWGQSTRGVQQLRLVGGVLASDSTGRPLLFDADGNLYVVEASPLNTIYDTDAEIYNDTLSVNGRSYDSTSVIQVNTFGSIALGLKMSGHHGAAGGEVRLGITALWSNASGATDTSMTFASAVGRFSAASTTVDSIGAEADGTAHTVIPGTEIMVRLLNFSAISKNTMAHRTASVALVNPGFQYVRFLFRVISDTGTTATQGHRFRLRASAYKRAL